MRKDKEKIFELRRAGKSYNEIGKTFNISKGTLWKWFKEDSSLDRVTVQNGEKSKSLDGLLKMREARRQALSLSYASSRDAGRAEFLELSRNSLFIAGLCLYWGEGDKKSRGHIRITNIEPKLVKIFILFASHVLGVDKSKIKISLLLYPDLDVNICLRYWEESLGLSSENFYKPSIIQGRHKINRLHYGVCCAGFSSTLLKQKLLVWLEMIGDLFFVNNAGVV